MELRPAVTRGCASDCEADAAAAGGDRVGVLDLESLTHQVIDEIEFGAAQHLQRDRVDDNAHAVAADNEVVIGPLGVDVEGVLEARAAAALDRNAQRCARRSGEHLRQAARGGRADRHRGGANGFGNLAHRSFPGQTIG